MMIVYQMIDKWIHIELGYLIAELNSGRYFKNGLELLKVTVVGASKDVVKTVGGLKIIPNMSHDGCE